MYHGQAVLVSVWTVKWNNLLIQSNYEATRRKGKKKKLEINMYFLFIEFCGIV